MSAVEAYSKIQPRCSEGNFIGTSDTALSAAAPLSLDKHFRLLFFVNAFEQNYSNIYYIKMQVFFREREIKYIFKFLALGGFFGYN